MIIFLVVANKEVCELMMLVLFLVDTSFEFCTRHLISPTSTDKFRDIDFNYFAVEGSNLGFYFHQNRSKNLRNGIAHRLWMKPTDAL